ncbi:MAG TPA: hypothetical protein VNP72_11065, partial [Longimicrobium sp.]|nr:hypothetical protein [Longimicrobium sp.]
RTSGRGSMAYREFEDANGVQWKAWDTVPSSGANVRARYARGWLTFESEIERRRVSPIPDGWEAGDEAALCGWLQNGSVIQPANLDDLPAKRDRDAADAPAALDALPLGIRRAREVIRSIGRTLGV